MNPPRWTALVPIKAAPERKQRLATILAPADRVALSEVLLARLLDALHAVPRIADIRLLTPAPLPGARWLRDHGRGLNAELAAARALLGPVPLLVIHPDLVQVAAADVAALLDVAEARGRAIAPDRHGRGTNAIALADSAPFAFAFGADSRARHEAQGAATLIRDGLAHDIDTPDDLAAAAAGGFAPHLR